MIILGIDPGTAALGYGVVERTGGRIRPVDFGCVTTIPADPLPERLLEIHRAVVDLIETHRPELVAVERLFFSRNAQTAIGVGQARGVILLAAAQAGLPVREPTPSEVKTAVAGYGSADKEQVGRMVALILGLDRTPTPDDAADGLAIAIWAASRERPGERHTSAVLDRSAVAPIVGTTPFDRAVREAIEREREVEKRSTTRPAARRRAS
ncbi:MAG TPA: crossover junction endodeoxyribonuclease RuvC [Candidatus Binatia bacterium]|nr:crossover junction endodeoxyribonuclease RuvC [Candidatus Binatia bacterium]